MTSDGTYNYQWDAEGRMKSINATGTCSPTTMTACYAYNALGQMVEEWGTGVGPRRLVGGWPTLGRRS